MKKTAPYLTVADRYERLLYAPSKVEETLSPFQITDQSTQPPPSATGDFLYVPYAPAPVQDKLAGLPMQLFKPPVVQYGTGPPAVLDEPPKVKSNLEFPAFPSAFGQPPRTVEPVASVVGRNLDFRGIPELSFDEAHRASLSEPPTLSPRLALSMPKAFSPAPQPPKPTGGTEATTPKSMAPTPTVKVSTVGQGMERLSPLLQKEARTGRKVVVSIPDKRVVVYDQSGNEVRSYPVYVGTSKDPTPRGQFRIMESVKPDLEEWYYGPRWLGFAKGYSKSPGYAGFHGWVYTKSDDELEAASPGWKTSTHGCIQMSNVDVAEFSTLVGVGDPVSIIDKPITPPAPSPPKVQMRQRSVFETLLRGGT